MYIVRLGLLLLLYPFALHDQPQRGHMQCGQLQRDHLQRDQSQHSLLGQMDVLG